MSLGGRAFDVDEMKLRVEALAMGRGCKSGQRQDEGTL